MPQLYIVRHGNTFDPGDTVLRVGGRTDLPLSRSGQAQAEGLGASFARAGIAFAVCASAPLKRTRQTAEAIIRHQGASPSCLDFEALREVDYGPDEGRPENEVVARIGEAALAAWEHEAIPPSGWRVDPDALRAAWRGLFQRFAVAEGPVLVVTSNGVARFVLDVIKGSEGAPRKLRTGAYGVVELSPGNAGQLVTWDQRPEPPTQT